MHTQILCSDQLRTQCVSSRLSTKRRERMSIAPKVKEEKDDKSSQSEKGKREEETQAAVRDARGEGRCKSRSRN